MRPFEIDISTLSSTGIPAPLGSYHRQPKQHTKGNVPDDGYHIMETTNARSYKDPVVHMERPKHVLSMIDNYNLEDLMMSHRPVRQKMEGFGTLIPKHERNHEQRYLSTEYRDYVANKEVPSSH